MSKREETTSFVIRFSQKMYKDDKGETQVQWRGNIRHVQSGNEQRFVEFNKAMEFIQDQLAELTLQSVEGKPKEEQKGILSKSFEIWKKVATDAPKMVMETILDPKGQVEQIQNQVEQVRENLGQTIETELNQWRRASKSDIQQLVEVVNNIAADVKELKVKMDKLTPKEKK